MGDKIGKKEGRSEKIRISGKRGPPHQETGSLPCQARQKGRIFEWFRILCVRPQSCDQSTAFFGQLCKTGDLAERQSLYYTGRLGGAPLTGFITPLPSPLRADAILGRHHKCASLTRRSVRVCMRIFLHTRISGSACDHVPRRLHHVCSS